MTKLNANLVSVAREVAYCRVSNSSMEVVAVVAKFFLRCAARISAVVALGAVTACGGSSTPARTGGHGGGGMSGTGGRYAINGAPGGVGPYTLSCAAP